MMNLREMWGKLLASLERHAIQFVESTNEIPPLAAFGRFIRRYPKLALTTITVVVIAEAAFMVHFQVPTFVPVLAAVCGPPLFWFVVWFAGRRGRKSIARVPGFTLRRVLSFLVSRKTFTRVYEPAIADMQLEYMEAVENGEKLRAVWVSWRGRASVLMAALLQLPFSLGRMIYRLWTLAS